MQLYPRVQWKYVFSVHACICEQIAWVVSITFSYHANEEKPSN